MSGTPAIQASAPDGRGATTISTLYAAWMQAAGTAGLATDDGACQRAFAECDRLIQAMVGLPARDLREARHKVHTLRWMMEDGRHAADGVATHLEDRMLHDIECDLLRLERDGS